MLDISALVSCIHVTTTKHSPVWKLRDVWRLLDELVLVHGRHRYNIESVHVLQEQRTKNYKPARYIDSHSKSVTNRIVNEPYEVVDPTQP